MFDKDIITYSRSDMCQFEHEGKKIKLIALPTQSWIAWADAYRTKWLRELT